MTQFGELLQASGFVLWVLIAVSVVALAIVIYKQWQFFEERPEADENIREALRIWHEQGRGVAVESLRENPCFGSDVVISAMLSKPAEGTVKTADERAKAERRIEIQGSQKLRELRSFLPALEGIGTLSPLLGLLGTVLGMIAAFQAMEIAGNEVDPSTLSGGIWQALLTTAMGLIVAIPTLALHNWMERKVQRVAEKLDDAVGQILNSPP